MYFKIFNYQLSSEIKKKYGVQGIIFARNVIPHVENIHSVVKGISNLIDKNNKSLVAIEFHNSSSILNELHYDSIYHEHIFFFFQFRLFQMFLKNMDCLVLIFLKVQSVVARGFYFFQKKEIKRALA